MIFFEVKLEKESLHGAMPNAPLGNQYVTFCCLMMIISDTF